MVSISVPLAAYHFLHESFAAQRYVQIRVELVNQDQEKWSWGPIKRSWINQGWSRGSPGQFHFRCEDITTSQQAKHNPTSLLREVAHLFTVSSPDVTEPVNISSSQSTITPTSTPCNLNAVHYPNHRKLKNHSPPSANSRRSFTSHPSFTEHASETTHHFHQPTDQVARQFHILKTLPLSDFNFLGRSVSCDQQSY